MQIQVTVIKIINTNSIGIVKSSPTRAVLNGYMNLPTCGQIAGSFLECRA